MTKHPVILLFLLNFFISFFAMNAGLFHSDSVNLAQTIEKTYATGKLQPGPNGRYGTIIINSLLHYPFHLFGRSADFTVRFSGILFHSLSIIMLFFFINELFADGIMAFFVSLLFSFVPFYFSPNTYGKEHGLGMTVLFVSLFLLCRGTRNGSLFLICISSFLMAATVTIREAMLLSLPLYFILFFHPRILLRKESARVSANEDVFSLRKLFLALIRDNYAIEFPVYARKLKYVLAATLPFCLLFSFLFYGYLFKVIHNSFSFGPATCSVFFGLFSPILKLACKDILTGVSALVLILFILGARKMIADKKLFLTLFFFLWLMIIFYVGNISLYSARYLDIVVVPIFVFAGYYVRDMYKIYKIIAMVTVLICVLHMLFFSSKMLATRHLWCGPKEFALYVKDHTEPDAVVIAIDEYPFIEYYSHRTTLVPRVSMDRRDVVEFNRKLSGYIRNDTPVYLISSAFAYDDRTGLRKNLLTNFELYFIGEKFNEEFHRPEFSLQTFKERLYRLNPKTRERNEFRK